MNSFRVLIEARNNHTLQNCEEINEIIEPFIQQIGLLHTKHQSVWWDTVDRLYLLTCFFLPLLSPQLTVAGCWEHSSYFSVSILASCTVILSFSISEVKYTPCLWSTAESQLPWHLSGHGSSACFNPLLWQECDSEVGVKGPQLGIRRLLVWVDFCVPVEITSLGLTFIFYKARSLNDLLRYFLF